jgi:hypothetical protein
MSSQVTVYSGAITNAVWSTDKVRINTGTNSVTFQVNTANLANGSATGNTIYSNAIVIPANSKYDAFVGVGNYVTIAGGNSTAEAIGTTSSGTYAVQ